MATPRSPPILFRGGWAVPFARAPRRGIRLVGVVLTPRPPLPRRELRERGSLRRPSSLHNQLHLTHSSQLPSHFPSPPGPLSHGASLGRGGASGVPVAYTANHSLIPSSQLSLSPQVGEGWRSRGEGNHKACLTTSSTMQGSRGEGNHPSPREWERGRGKGMPITASRIQHWVEARRATLRSQLRATGEANCSHPLGCGQGHGGHGRHVWPILGYTETGGGPAQRWAGPPIVGIAT